MSLSSYDPMFFDDELRYWLIVSVLWDYDPGEVARYYKPEGVP